MAPERRKLSSPYKVIVLVGSLRKDSFNRKVAHAVEELSAAALKFQHAEIGNLPLYNQDLETANPPEEWSSFRREIQTADAALFVTPEYNRSIPGCLKNAIDVGSRPYGSSAWQGMPAGVISVSPGAMGGFGANQNLRQCFVFLNMPVMQQPEAYLGGAATWFDEHGKLTNENIREFLGKFVKAFAQWIERNRKR
jgi:chromate reductase